jgi:hypothetical protein
MKRFFFQGILFCSVLLLLARTGITAVHFHELSPVPASEEGLSFDHAPHDCSICSLSVISAEPVPPRGFSPSVSKTELQPAAPAGSVLLLQLTIAGDRAPPVW